MGYVEPFLCPTKGVVGGGVCFLQKWVGLWSPGSYKRCWVGGEALFLQKVVNWGEVGGEALLPTKGARVGCGVCLTRGGGGVCFRCHNNSVGITRFECVMYTHLHTHYSPSLSLSRKTDLSSFVSTS